MTKVVNSRNNRTEKKYRGRDYASRRYLLQEMGFASYSDYLASDLWKRIRQKVYAVYGTKCVICSAKATELHHLRYHRNDLKGKSIKFIRPVCRGCHESCEFVNGKKSTLRGANAIFSKMLAASKGQPGDKSKKCRGCRNLASKDKDFCGRCVKKGIPVCKVIDVIPPTRGNQSTQLPGRTDEAAVEHAARQGFYS